MPFAGHELNSCSLTLFKYREAYVVVVSGVAANPCGHMLLNLGGPNGHYVHIDGMYSKPKYLTWHDYGRYLAVNDKRELYRVKVDFPMPWRALGYLEKLMDKKWAFGFVFHNCTNFVEEVVRAGGGFFNVQNNCPIKAIGHNGKHIQYD